MLLGGESKREVKTERTLGTGREIGGSSLGENVCVCVKGVGGGVWIKDEGEMC